MAITIIPSAATIQLVGSFETLYDITGTTTISSILTSGRISPARFALRFASALTVVNSTNLDLGGFNIITKPGDTLEFTVTGQGVALVSKTTIAKARVTRIISATTGTVALTDDVVVVQEASATTLTLPDAASALGQTFTVAALGAGGTTVNPAGSDHISPAATTFTLAQGITNVFLSLPKSGGGAIWVAYPPQISA